MIVDVRRHARADAAGNLDHEGRDQAAALHRLVGGCDLVVASTAPRAQETARLIADRVDVVTEAMGVADLVIGGDLASWTWRWFLEGGHRSGAEIVARRFLAALDEAVDGSSAETVLVITHDGVVQSVAAVLGRPVGLDDQMDVRLANGAGVRLVGAPGAWRVDRFLPPPPTRDERDGARGG